MNDSYTGQYPQGLTIRELKALLADAPETDESGEEYEVWVETGPWSSSIVAKTWKLNSGDLLLEPKTSGDLLLGANEWEERASDGMPVD